MPKRRWWIAVGIAATLGVAVGAVAVAAPSIAAVACPRCYGLTGLGGGVYAERDDDAYRRMVDAAGERVAAFYGGREAHARVLICATEACYRRIGGGGEKGRALRTDALLLSPQGANEVIAAHELAHLELNQRLGPARSKVPSWFNEGLAVLVSEDPRYLRPGPDRCRVPYEQALTITRTDWSAVRTDGYPRAACVVSHWVADRGGPSAVLEMISDLRAGKEVFDHP
ncbi:hypothetical protein BJY16_006199 [Actinoplanes octamycinicus]|uniref:Peptidase MA superfamily protein n=1 Tax=Actinoplanes octamycinicus TaxID=135948 RepID=A0A7W7MAD9_9ACTN|nr:hypothetical protein [Actinoplanes octamycinicus]MBB4742740.1 hypothetical protein [Actinoplanes octamycinicus]GIE63040.1 hypothetical protein Aoc01nite_84420 [Actinoplanes octamycinicus]